MPAWFAYPAQAVQLWTPVIDEEPAELMQAFDDHAFTVIARLQPGVSQLQGVAEALRRLPGACTISIFRSTFASDGVYCLSGFQLSAT